jgi:hypothetical protein
LVIADTGLDLRNLAVTAAGRAVFVMKNGVALANLAPGAR